MSNDLSAPKLLVGRELRVTRKVTLIFGCPKCTNDLDVTSITGKATIECLKCNNVTWLPDYQPPWWSKLKTFVLSLVVSFLVGVISSIAGTYAWVKIHNVNNKKIELEQNKESK